MTNNKFQSIDTLKIKSDRSLVNIAADHNNSPFMVQIENVQELSISQIKIYHIYKFFSEN